MLRKLMALSIIGWALALPPTTPFQPTVAGFAGENPKKAPRAAPDSQANAYAMNLGSATTASLPRAVDDLQAEPGPEPGAIKLMWSTPEGAALYWIQYATNPIGELGTFKPDGDLKVTFSTSERKGKRRQSELGMQKYFVIHDLPSGETLWFVLRSVSEAGNLSSWSNTVQVTVP